MKRHLLTIATSFICSVMLCGCGGTSYPSNEYLGTIPGIYADYNAQLEALENKADERAKKFTDAKDLNALVKLHEELEEDKKEAKAKLKDDLAQEIPKIIGREIPISFSTALQNSPELFYTIDGAKLEEKDGSVVIPLQIRVKNDFTVPAYQGLSTYAVYYGQKLADGRIIDRSVFLPISLDTKERKFEVGQLLSGPEKSTITFRFGRSGADLVNFAGIEFITKEEYNAK